MTVLPRRRGAIAAALAGLAAAAVVLGTPASASVRFAPASRATVHPGVSVTLAGVTCAAGYVLTDGYNVYLALPASCTGVSDGAAADGCTEAQIPYGVAARIAGARYPGRFVYSSFYEMQATGRRDANACAANSLSLIRLDRRDIGRTNPSVPLYGGPTGVGSASPAMGDQLALYQGGTARTGYASGDAHSSWQHGIVTTASATKTDRGSVVLSSDGRAVGMLTELAKMPGGPAQVGDLRRELVDLRRVHGYTRVWLANGTQRFAIPS